MDDISVHDESFNEFDTVESLIEEDTIPSDDNDAGTIPEDPPSEFESEASDELSSTSDVEETETLENCPNVYHDNCDDVSESESEVTDARDVDSETINGDDEGQMVSQVHPVQVHDITSTNNKQQFEAPECGSQKDISDLSAEQLDQESTDCESLIDKCEVENTDEKEKVELVSKVPPLDRKESDGTSFWSYSARNSVVSILDSNQESREHDNVEGGEIESPRKILQKKRSSLSHKPDIVRVFEKKSIQQNGDVHEFQKVMCGLKHVEDQSYDIKKLSQVDHEQDSGSSPNKKANVKATDNIENQSNEKKVVSNAKMASDMKVDLIQDAVEKDLVVSKAQTKEDKLTALTKKKQSNKTVVKTSSRVTPQEKDMEKDNQTGKLKKSNSKSNTLVKTKSKPQVEVGTKSATRAENDPSLTTKVVKQARKVGSAIGNSKDNLKGKSVGKDKPLNKTNVKQKPSDKDIPSIEKPVSPDIISAHKNSRRKDSAESQDSKKSDVSEVPAVESDNPADLSDSNGGGFLAPTRAWLSHMGDKIDVRSRTPSPGANEKKTSPATTLQQKDGTQPPGARTANEGKKNATNQAVKKSEKLPKDPPVKRTFSLKSKPITPKVENSIDLKRSTSLRKPRNQGKEAPAASDNSKSKSSPSKKINPPSVRNAKGSDKNANHQTKNQSDHSDEIDSPAALLPKKVPPPVAPKPACPNKLNTGCQLTDSAQTVCDNSTMKTTAMVTLNQAAVKPVVKKMINKTSIAEIAKLADSLEIVVNETLHQTQFVSQAKATLSPVPQRKIRDAINAAEDVEDDNDSVIESGIVSESVSASSVIQMFGGVGKFKKVVKEDPVASPPSDPVSSVNEEPVLEAKEAKKKGGDLKRADSKKMSSGKSHTKEKQAPKSSTSQVLASKQKTQEPAKISRSQGSTKTRKDKASNLSESKHDNLQSSQKQQNSLVKTDSSKSISKESTFVKTPAKTTKKETPSIETSKATQKKTAENKVGASVSEKTNSHTRSSNSKDDLPDPKPDNKTNGSLVKTTMVVRLHPGQNRKLSTMEDQEAPTTDQSEPVDNSCGWLAEVQAEDDPASVCGLEISFKSVPQDIDIKLISGQQEKTEVKQPGAKGKSVSKSSITRKSIDLSSDQNKTRQ